MFSFDIPVNGALQVSLPTGGSALMVHVGGGRFLCKVPPLVILGISRDEPARAEVDGLPVTWDGQTLPGDCQAHPMVFQFDVAAAQAAVEKAAAAGDIYANAVLDEIRRIDAMMAAREAVLSGSEPAAGGGAGA